MARYPLNLSKQATTYPKGEDVGFYVKPPCIQISATNAIKTHIPKPLICKFCSAAPGHLFKKIPRTH